MGVRTELWRGHFHLGLWGSWAGPGPECLAVIPLLSQHLLLPLNLRSGSDEDSQTSCWPKRHGTFFRGGNTLLKGSLFVFQFLNKAWSEISEAAQQRPRALSQDSDHPVRTLNSTPAVPHMSLC